jgi:hypothetical protein
VRRDGDSRYWRRLKSTGLIALALVPPFAILFLIRTFGVNIPFKDDWILVPFALEAQAGTVTFADLWAQHNEHRIVLARLVLMLLLPLTRFNSFGFLAVAYCMAVTALALFWLALRLSSFPGARVPSVATLIPISFLTFSIVPYESWLHALTALQWQTIVLGAACTVWALARWPGSWKALAVAACCTAVSALSIASGLALLPAAVIGAVLSATSRRWRWTAIGLGIALLGFFASVYFVGYIAPATEPTPLATLLKPRSIAAFLLAYLGSPFSLRLEASIVFGAAGIALSAGLIGMVLRRSDIPRASVAPWIALMVYALSFALIVAIGRAGLGAEAAMARRYPAAAALLWVSTAALLARLLSSGSPPSWNRWTTAPKIAVALGILVAETGYLGANLNAMIEAVSLQRLVAAARDEIVAQRGPDTNAAFTFLFPWDPELAREYSRQLQEAGLGP